MNFKPTTHQKIEQRVKELLYPTIEAGKTYYFNSPSGGHVARLVVEVRGEIVRYAKLDKMCLCRLITFQRLYQQYGVEEAK
jgi:hypothetical protein